MGPIGLLASILPGKSTIPAGNGFDAAPAAARGAKVSVVAASAAEIARALSVFSICQVFRLSPSLISGVPTEITWVMRELRGQCSVRVMGRSRQVKDVLVVDFDIFHSMGHAIIHGVNQGGRRIGGNSAVDPVGVYSVSVSVALLLARFGSETPLGTVTVAVLESVPVADELIQPIAL